MAGFQTTASTGVWDTDAYWTTDAAGNTGPWVTAVSNNDFKFTSGSINSTPNSIFLDNSLTARGIYFLNGRWTISGGGLITLGIGGINSGVGGSVGATNNISNTISNSILLSGPAQTWTNSSTVTGNNTAIAGIVSGSALTNVTQTINLVGSNTVGSGFTLSGYFTDGTNGGRVGITVKSSATIPTASNAFVSMQITGTFNDYTGATLVQNGALQVSSLADEGIPSSLGAPTGALSVIGLGLANSTNSTALIYNSTGPSFTNRAINLAGGAATTTLANNSTSVDASVGYTGAITAAAGNKTLILGGSNLGDNTIGGAIPDPAGGATKLALTKNGAGRWTLNGVNTYSGGTTISAGTLAIGAGSNLGTNVVGNNIAIQGGNLLLNADSNIGSNQTITVSAAGGGIGVSYDPITFPTVTDNSGSVGGVFGINYTGTGGIGSVAGVNALFTATSSWSLGSFAGGTPGIYTGSSLPVGAGNTYRLGGGGGELTVANNILTGANNLIVGVTSGSGGILHLPNANDYSGTTSIQNGTLTISSLKNVGGGASSLGAPTTAGNGTISLGSGTNAVTLTYAGAGDTSDRILNFAGTTGTVTIGNSGSGALHFTSTPTFTGVGAKTVALGTATDVVGGSIGGIADSSSGKTSLTKNGLGTWSLLGANTYTGDTTINAGILKTVNAAALANSYVKLTAANLATSPIWETNGTLTRTITNTSTPGGLGWSSFTGFAAQGGKLTLNFGGTPLVWNTGGFMGSGGATMIFGSATADSQVELTTGLNLNTNDRFARLIHVNQGVGGDSALISGVISNNGAVGAASGIDKRGAGILILSGDNTYSGETIISEGTLVAGRDVPVVGSSGAFGTGAGAPGATPVIQPLPNISIGTATSSTNNASPSLMIGGAFTVARPVVINASTSTGTFSIGGNTDNNASFTGAITANHSFSIRQVATTGGHALTISGTIAGPPLTDPPTTLTALTVNFDNVGKVVASGVISNGTGAVPLTVTKTNVGIAGLAAANLYTGGTVISGGSLIAEINGALGTGNVSVSSSAISLTIQTGVTNAIFNTAVLSLSGGGTPLLADMGFLDLLGSDTVGGLILAGIAQGPGTYGSTASGAQFTNDEFFSGLGILTVAVPEPNTIMLLTTAALGMGIFTLKNRRLRKDG